MDANDLKNMDSILYKAQRITNDTPKNQELIEELRNIIANTLSKIKIKVK